MVEKEAHADRKSGGRTKKIIWSPVINPGTEPLTGPKPGGGRGVHGVRSLPPPTGTIGPDFATECPTFCVSE